VRNVVAKAAVKKAVVRTAVKRAIVKQAVKRAVVKQAAKRAVVRNVVARNIVKRAAISSALENKPGAAMPVAKTLKKIYPAVINARSLDTAPVVRPAVSQNRW